jgi:hypothetical protein
VGPGDDDRSQDPGAGGSGAAPVEGGGGVEGCRRGRVPERRRQEQVVFASFFERGFDFFCGLMYYYQLELVHLVPNSITVVSTFIHFCEAYLGISPHFLLWRYFFCVKSTGKRSGPVGDVMFNLRSGLKAEWIDTDLPDNTAGWRSEWFYIANQIFGLPRRTGHRIVKINEWDLGLSSRDLKELEPVLELVSELKKQGWQELQWLGRSAGG